MRVAKFVLNYTHRNWLSKRGVGEVLRGGKVLKKRQVLGGHISHRGAHNHS